MRFYPIGGGGGADLDVVTAGAEHVLAPKVIVDKDGNPITGAMIDRTGTALTVATNGQTLIPQGYHDGTQYAKNTQATLAGGTLTPSTSQVTVNCNGKLMTSNYVIPAFSLPSASIILSGKKVTIYGKSVTGTAQQFIKTGTEIKTSIFSIMSGYFYKDSSVFELGADSASNTPYARSDSAFNLTGYRYVKIPSRTTAGSVRVGVSSNSNGSNIRWGGWLSTGGTPIVDVSDLSGMYFIYAQGTGNGSVTSSFKVGDSYYSKYYYSFATGTISNS